MLWAASQSNSKSTPSPIKTANYNVHASIGTKNEKGCKNVEISVGLLNSNKR